MANLIETATYDAAVPQLETNTIAIGGPGGVMNAQAQALANRTKFLKDVLDSPTELANRLPDATTSVKGKVQLASTGVQDATKVPKATGAELAALLTAGGYSLAPATGASNLDNIADGTNYKRVTADEKTLVSKGIEVTAQAPWTPPVFYYLDAARFHLERISGGRATIFYSASGKVPIEAVWVNAFNCADVSPDFSRARANSTAYSIGALLTANGQLYEVTTAGTTGSAPPTYPTTVGSTVTDGTAVLTLVQNAYNDLYPAFSVAGTAKGGKWFSRFLCDVVSGKPRSIAGQLPAYATIDQIRAYAIAFGNGALPMTYWDYEALALDAYRKGIVPVGNTYYGKSHKSPEGVWGGVRGDGARPGDTTVTSDPRTRGGSAGSIWTHDRSMWGVHDFVGNYWRWVDGVKWMDGELYIHAYDNDPTLLTTAGEGSWIATGVFLNSPVAGDDLNANDLGAPNFASSVTNYTASVVPPRALATIQADTRDLDYASQTWSAIAVDASIDAVDAAKRITAFKMGILPKVRSGGASPLSTQEGRLWIRNNGERFTLRAGAYLSTSDAGPESSFASNRRSGAYAFGFVFVE